MVGFKVDLSEIYRVISEEEMRSEGAVFIVYLNYQDVSGGRLFGYACS